MSNFTIQEQFEKYLYLVNKMHELGHDIDAAINEVDISDYEDKRTAYKRRLQLVTKNLVDSLKAIDMKYPIHNYLLNQTTYLYVEDDKLMFEYH